MRKILIWLLTIVGFISGLFFYLTVSSENVTSSKEVISFVHPLVMLLLAINVMALPNVSRLKQIYRRYKKGMEHIFLSVSIVVLVLHVAVMLYAAGFLIHLIALVPLCVGIVFITTGNTLPRFKVPEDEQVSITSISSKYWNKLVRPLSLHLFIGGAAMIICAFAPENIILPLFFTVLFFTIASILFRSRKIIKTEVHSL